MKTIFVLISAVVFTLIISGSKTCNSQVVAIGHVSAEVIESVSAASDAVSDFELTTSAAGAAGIPETSLTSETLKLGVLTINSGKDITCNVVVKMASLADSSGNGFTLSPFVKNDSFASAGGHNGSQTVELSGKTSRTGNQPSGLYQGSYTVVFAYN